MHDGDAGGERHRLDLVVGDVDRRLVEPLIELLDLGAHLDPQLGVEIGKRLVEQEQRGIAHQRSSHGHALALAAGKLGGLAAKQAFDLQKRGHPGEGYRLRLLWYAAALHAKGNVGADRHRWIERVGLEHHGDIAILGRHAIDDALANPDLAGADAFKAGDHGEQSRLSAARRSDQHHEFSRFHLQVDAFQYGRRAEGFVEVANRQGSHVYLLFDGPLRQPAQKIPAAKKIDQERRQSGNQHGSAFDIVLTHRRSPGAERDQRRRDRLVGA